MGKVQRRIEVQVKILVDCDWNMHIGQQGVVSCNLNVRTR